MKKFIAVAGLALIGVFALAACGQKAEEAVETAPPADTGAIPDSTTTAPPTPSDTVIPPTTDMPPPGEPLPSTPPTDTPPPDTMGKPPTNPPQ